MKTFAQFVEDKGMEGMSVKGGHKRTVKQGASLTKKGVEKYRRQNPKYKLQTAVTTPPSKLNPDSKLQKDANHFVQEVEVGQAREVKQATQMELLGDK